MLHKFFGTPETARNSEGGRWWRTEEDDDEDHRRIFPRERKHFTVVAWGKAQCIHTNKLTHVGGRGRGGVEKEETISNRFPRTALVVVDGLGWGSFGDDIFTGTIENYEQIRSNSEHRQTEQGKLANKHKIRPASH